MKGRYLITIRFITLIFISFSMNVIAQDKGSVDTKSVNTHSNNLTLQHITLVVSNFSESKKFYTDILQLEDLNADWLPENQMFLSLGDNLELHVGEVAGVEIKPSDFNHFAISTNDLDKFLIYLKNKGIEYSRSGSVLKNTMFKQDRMA